MTVGEQLLESERIGRQIMWLGAVAALEIAIALGLFPSLAEIEGGAARLAAVAIVILSILAGIAMFYCIATFDKSARTARSLIDGDAHLRFRAIDDEEFFDSETIRDLNPHRADRAFYLLLGMAAINALAVAILACLVAYGERKLSDPRINVEVSLPERPPPPPPPPSVQQNVTVAPPAVNVAVEVQRGDEVILSRVEMIFFDEDEAEGPEVEDQVEQIAGRVAEWRHGWPCRIRVQGHADSRESDQHNFDLSNHRVETAIRLLKPLIPDAEITRGKGAGERRLLELTGDETDSWINRRVEVAVECRK